MTRTGPRCSGSTGEASAASTIRRASRYTAFVIGVPPPAYLHDPVKAVLSVERAEVGRPELHRARRLGEPAVSHGNPERGNDRLHPAAAVRCRVVERAPVEREPLLAAMLALEILLRIQRHEDAAGRQRVGQPPRPLLTLLQFPVHEPGLRARRQIGQLPDVLTEGVVKLSYPQVRVLTTLFATLAVRVAEEEKRPVISGRARRIPIVSGRSGLVASVHSAPFPPTAAYADIG